MNMNKMSTKFGESFTNILGSLFFSPWIWGDTKNIGLDNIIPKRNPALDAQ